jgi:hypothetical protein
MKSRPLLIDALLLLLFLACLPAAAEPLPLADGYQGLWYSNTATHDEYKFKYSGGMATYPQQHEPIAIYRKEVNKTFFVFGGTTDPSNVHPQLLHMVAYYDHATGTVSRPRLLLNKKTEDAHDNATLSIDDAGHLFIFCNAHGTGRKSYIFRSTKPYSIDEFEKTFEGNFSYGQPWHVSGGGFLLLHTKYEKGSDHNLFFMTSPDGSPNSWTEPTRLATYGHGHYQISWPLPDGKTIATAFDFHPGGLDTRTNLYYLQTPDLGRTWLTVDGKPVTLPLTDKQNAALVHDYQAEKLNVYLKDLQFDAAGQPIILYLTSKGPRPGPANEPYQWLTAHWLGDRWEIRPFTTSDHNYDHGSMAVRADGSWTVIAPTDPGPAPYATGGEMVLWSTKDQGATWTRVKAVTHDSPLTQNYLRRPLDARDDVWGIWADGNAREASASSLYFTDIGGAHVYRLPAKMTTDAAKPDLVKE